MDEISVSSSLEKKETKPYEPGLDESEGQESDIEQIGIDDIIFLSSTGAIEANTSDEGETIRKHGSSYLEFGSLSSENRNSVSFNEVDSEYSSDSDSSAEDDNKKNRKRRKTSISSSSSFSIEKDSKRDDYREDKKSEERSYSDSQSLAEGRDLEHSHHQYHHHHHHNHHHHSQHKQKKQHNGIDLNSSQHIENNEKREKHVSQENHHYRHSQKGIEEGENEEVITATSHSKNLDNNSLRSKHEKQEEMREKKYEELELKQRNPSKFTEDLRIRRQKQQELGKFTLNNEDYNRINSTIIRDISSENRNERNHYSFNNTNNDNNNYSDNANYNSESILSGSSSHSDRNDKNDNNDNCSHSNSKRDESHSSELGNDSQNLQSVSESNIPQPRYRNYSSIYRKPFEARSHRRLSSSSSFDNTGRIVLDPPLQKQTSIPTYGQSPSFLSSLAQPPPLLSSSSSPLQSQGNYFPADYSFSRTSLASSSSDSGLDFGVFSPFASRSSVAFTHSGPLELSPPFPSDSNVLSLPSSQEYVGNLLPGVKLSLPPNPITPNYRNEQLSGVGRRIGVSTNSNVRSTSDYNSLYEIKRISFKREITKIIVKKLSYYWKAKRIDGREDFKHLSRKISHKIMKKEEGKYELTANTPKKIKKYIDSFFKKHNQLYKRKQHQSKPWELPLETNLTQKSREIRPLQPPITIPVPSLLLKPPSPEKNQH